MHCCLYLEILKNILFEIVFSEVQRNKGAPAWAGTMHHVAAHAGGCGPASSGLCTHVGSSLGAEEMAQPCLRALLAPQS